MEERAGIMQEGKKNVTFLQICEWYALQKGCDRNLIWYVLFLEVFFFEGKAFAGDSCSEEHSSVAVKLMWATELECW